MNPGILTSKVTFLSITLHYLPTEVGINQGNVLDKGNNSFKDITYSKNCKTVYRDGKRVKKSARPQNNVDISGLGNWEGDDTIQWNGKRRSRGQMMLCVCLRCPHWCPINTCTCRRKVCSQTYDLKQSIGLHLVVQQGRVSGTA